MGNMKSKSWTEKQRSLGVEFLEAEAKGNEWGWQAAKLAFDLRGTFPRKSGHGEPGWEDFCGEVLNRNPRTVSTYVRASQYCDHHVQGWSQRLSTLPPWYLVAELAAREPGERREVLHEELFSGFPVEVEDFRKALAKLREAEHEDEHVNAGTHKVDGSKGASERTADSEQLNLGKKSDQPIRDSREAPDIGEEPEGPSGDAGAVQDRVEPSTGLHPFWAALRGHGALSDQGADYLAGLARDRQVQLFGQVCERAEVDVLTADEIDEGLAGALKEDIASLLGLADPEEQVAPPTPGPTPPQSGAKGDITPTFTAPSAEVVVAESGSVLEVTEAEWRNEIATAMADERTFVSHLKRGLLMKMKEASK